MTASCENIRAAIEDGEVIDGMRAHLEACSACRQHAGLLAVLDDLQPGEADPAEVEAIMAALPVARWQRKLAVRWLPAVAGLFLMIAGFLVMGGLPAGGTVATLPGGLTGWIVATGLDAFTAARESSDAVRLVLAAGGVWLGLWMLLAAVGGGWSVLALARRSSSRR